MPNIIRIGDLPRAYSTEYLLVILAIEGRVAAQEDVHDDTAAPDVAFAVVGLPYDFGSDVIRRAYGLTQILVRIKLQRGAKIDDFNQGIRAGFVALQQNILRLDIAMDYVFGVAVADGDYYLIHYFGGVSLLEELSLHYHFEEFAAS